MYNYNYQCESCLTRQKILESLALTKMYLSQLALVLKMDRGTLAYHLGILEKEKWITSEYEILQYPAPKGKAARVYSIVNRENNTK